METFRLPGESQQIARITNTFAKHFMTYEPGRLGHIFCAMGRNSRIPAEVKNEDAVFILAYSIIMLNTDLHNPQIRVSVPNRYLVISGVHNARQKKMTLEDYSRNVRGINDGESFSPEFVVRSRIVCSALEVPDPPVSKQSTTRFGKGRLSCQKNTQVKWDSSMRGKNC